MELVTFIGKVELKASFTHSNYYIMSSGFNELVSLSVLLFFKKLFIQ